MRILAVDDDPIILDLLQSPMWLGTAHELTCADSAAAALAAIAASPAPFDVFLLDIVMPDTDGIALCAAIRALPAHAATPIIMITASHAADAMELAFQAGATDFVRKPLEGLELGARIHMASMLNASIARERSARATADNLRRRRVLGYDELAHAPDDKGPMPLVVLKNQILGLPAGCHAMSLFAIRVQPFALPTADLYDDETLLGLSMIGNAVVGALQHDGSRLAYGARGHFVGITLGRRREALDMVTVKARSGLSTAWKEAGFDGQPPTLKGTPVTSLGVWTGRAAVEALDKAITRQPDHRFADPESLLQRFAGV
ncbi:Response regulator receiver domain-containing protein [Loktanella fryxellensis]|uniref:Response regulator receiver domain-containing protein n=1 Tax=Loktanella fryxellensis TaxID=245187 RepID=A0A1H8D8S4_9RHOB|nr:response regulator [Loktanella fryxellensis]SEN03751.1 Response regulator receiver domain-containing protein [Loktanella fryxellensis]